MKTRVANVCLALRRALGRHGRHRRGSLLGGAEVRQRCNYEKIIPGTLFFASFKGGKEGGSLCSGELLPGSRN